ncbi:MAG: ROK family transcriptional regulator, partial [Pseudomonadota bacterium]
MDKALKASKHRKSVPGNIACGPLLAVASEHRTLRQRVVEKLRAAGQMSRVELARVLQVSPATVTALSAELIAAGLIEETDGPRDSTRGRPPVALTVAAGAHAVAGIKLSMDVHTAVVLDFAGGIIGQASRPALRHQHSVEDIISVAEDLLDDTLTAAGLDRGGLAGLGLGLPGVIEHERGRVMWSPMVAGRAVPLAKPLSERLKMPVVLDNDANLLTLAELWFGAGRAMDNFALVTIEHGVGMGLVINNRLFRGASGLGMELGHTKVALDGALCRCGRRGCLEAYVSDYALVREARTALNADGGPTETTRDLLGRLFQEAEAGHGAARTIFSRAGRHLAMGLANVVQLFDPSLIILAGGQVRFETLYADAVIAEMRALTLDTGRVPRVEVNAWGDMVWARGAAA